MKKMRFRRILMMLHTSNIIWITEVYYNTFSTDFKVRNFYRSFTEILKKSITDDSIRFEDEL